MKNILTESLAKYYLPEGNVITTAHHFDKGKVSMTMLNATRSTDKLIKQYFSPINALASKPVFIITSNTVIVYVFYTIFSFSRFPGKTDKIRTGKKSLNNNTVNNLGESLNRLFGRSVELRLIKLSYPYLNSYILAQYIAKNTQDYTLVEIIRQVFGSISPVKNTESINLSEKRSFSDSYLPSHIVGIKVRVSGRLMMERSRPRQTVQTAEIGTFAKNNLALVDNASFTAKNKKGAFTVKVWISQRAAVN